MTKSSKTSDDKQAPSSKEKPPKDHQNGREVSETVSRVFYSPEEISIIKQEEGKRRVLIKRVDRLVEDYFAMEEEEARKYNQLGFFPRILAVPSMPHSKPKTHEQVRKSGPYMMRMQAPSDIGLPYGAMPRYLVAWLTREILRTKNREISLGTSLSDFLGQINQKRGGGPTGSIIRLKDQFSRLLATQFSFSQESAEEDDYKEIRQFHLADSYGIWRKNSRNRVTEGKYWVTISESFFREAIKHPFPIDLRMFTALKGSSMAIDIYFWLTHRMSYLSKPTPIPWDALFVQFGAGYANDKKGRYAFKKKFTGYLDKVLVLYPGAKIRHSKTGVLLSPGKPHVLKLGFA